MRKLTFTGILLVLSCGREVTAPDPGRIAFRVVSGDNQVGVAGTELPDPLVVQVLQFGRPVRGVVVNFHVTNGGGSMFAGAVLTNRLGSAQDFWTLGCAAGAPQRVDVRSILPNGQRQVVGVFTATARAGPAVGLKFILQPSNVAVGVPISPAVQVAAVDACGNIDLTYAGPITLAVAVNPAAGVLSGTTTANAVSGISTFANLSLDKAGVGYTLQAFAPGLTSVESVAFAVF